MIAFHKIKWPNQAAVVFSNGATNTGMILRELLRNYGWRVTGTTHMISNVIEQVRGREANMIIIDDNVDSPATATLRQLMVDELTVLTPKICFLTDIHRDQNATLLNLTSPEITPKPLTPDKFIPSFRQVILTWSDGPFARLREICDDLSRGNHETGLRKLLELNENREVQNITAVSLALFCRKQNNFQLAEKVLLSALQNSPRNLGVILALSDFYLNTSMPMLAYKLLESARSAYGSNHAILFDLAQCQMMLEMFPEAIASLKTLAEYDYMKKDITLFLARLMFAEGRDSELKKLASTSTIYSTIEKSWAPAFVSNEAA